MVDKRRTESDMNIGGMLIKVLVSMIVIAIAAFFTPFFSISGLMPLLWASVAIGVIDWLIQKFTGFNASPFGRGITGFVVSAIIIYVTGMLVEGISVGVLGAVLAALAIGIVGMIIPGGKKVF